MGTEYKMRELDYLENYLQKHGIKCERIDEELGEYWNRYQLIVYNDAGERVWDAICQTGSYGYEQGLLEIFGEKITGLRLGKDNDKVIGWLTAEDVIERIENE